MIRTETTIRVRYVETDAMGFVHHANYLSWFELARIEMLDAINLSYKELETAGYYLPVLGAAITYRKPAYFDDRLKVVCYVRDPIALYFLFMGEHFVLHWAPIRVGGPKVPVRREARSASWEPP